jgi:uncharacterized protein YndB with AHSA1/START domain
MAIVKVSEWVDIQAPREEVFALITDIKRRMQLSPLWGTAKITQQCGDYPAVGSGYMVGLAEGQHPEYETVVTEYQPPSRFAYCLDVDMLTTVAWTVTQTPRGSRLTYTEEFQAPAENSEEFKQKVRKTIRDWLLNIQRYAELRESPGKRLIRWAVDRFYLNQRPDQRSTIVTVVFLQIVGLIAFIMAALSFGIARLFF